MREFHDVGLKRHLTIKNDAEVPKINLKLVRVGLCARSIGGAENAGVENAGANNRVRLL